MVLAKVVLVAAIACAVALGIMMRVRAWRRRRRAERARWEAELARDLGPRPGP